MALQKLEIKRKFIAEINGSEIELDDVNSSLTPEEVCDSYSGAYPELINASVESKGIVDDCKVYHFTTIAGTKA